MLYMVLAVPDISCRRSFHIKLSKGSKTSSAFVMSRNRRGTRCETLRRMLV